MSQIRGNFKLDQMAYLLRLMQRDQKYVFWTENIDKSVNICPEIRKNVVKNRFFVKTTYSQWPGNHFEHPIGSGMPVNCRDPQTVIWGKIGDFRFKSPHREQILLLL